MLIETTRYELPPKGTSLLGYIVRRMHKTEWQSEVPALLAAGGSAAALEKVGMYAMAASTSYGRAYYQPRFNRVGESVEETDPATGAIVRATLESDSPHYDIRYTVTLPNGDTFSGAEQITGTTVGLRGLSMPAPSRFQFASQDGRYQTSLTGLITSELALSLLGRTRIRAYGFLDLKDNLGNTGRLEFNRSGDVSVRINAEPIRQNALSGMLWLAGTA
jgi:hypothetical protein